MSSFNATPQRFLSCDWGTTRLRLRLVEWPDDAILAEYGSDDGVARLAGVASDKRPQAFQQALSRALSQIVAEHGVSVRALPIVVSGMASSSIGWRELPYATLPLALDGSGLVFESIGRVDPQHGGQVVLVSGLASQQDVMRGEEVESLGAARLMSNGPLRNEGILILPGTHSKHVHVHAGHIVGFQTYMTGELFDVLSSHSVLRHSLAIHGPVQSDSESTGQGDSTSTPRTAMAAAFDEGVQLGANAPLAAALFQVRTRGLLAGWPPADCRELLSGILIAAELVALRQPSAASLPIVLAAPPALSGAYAHAAIALGLASRLTVLPPADVTRLAVAGQSLLLPRILPDG